MVDIDVLPNKSPEPTAVGACRSAVAVHVASRRWLSFFVRLLMQLEAAFFYFMLFCVAVVFIAALVGFIVVQIKARPIWRLVSLAVVLVGSCWFCSFYTHETFVDRCSDTYVRGSAEFLEAIDQLSMQGRTNDVHQACQNFSLYFFLSTDAQDVSNFDRFIGDTEELASKQPNTALEPTATAPSVSHKP